MSELMVRSARPGDEDLIHELILELAAYERLSDRVRADAGDVRQALFDPRPRVFCEIIEDAGRPVGFALWFYSYSTFEGRAGLYLEDLYVRPEVRGRGAGRALLAALARRCRNEGLPRMEWAVLNWNEPAIAFYDHIGSAALDEWTTRRLTGPALAALAGEERSQEITGG